MNLCQKHLFSHQLTHNINDKTLFIDLPVQYMKTKSSEQFVYSTCSELVVFMYWSGKSMNNLLSYCGLVEPRISDSDKDLPVLG